VEARDALERLIIGHAAFIARFVADCIGWNALRTQKLRPVAKMTHAASPASSIVPS
jgi:hypothetical protein